MCDSWFSQSGVAENPSRQGHFAVSLDKEFPTFRKNAVPSSSRSSSPVETNDEGTVLFRIYSTPTILKYVFK